MARPMRRSPKAAAKGKRKMPTRGRGGTRSAPRKPSTSRRKGY